MGELHRRTIRRALIERTGAEVVSHVDGTIDVTVPASRDDREFRDDVEREVARLGYVPALEIRDQGSVVRVVTPETLQQRGRGSH